MQYRFDANNELWPEITTLIEAITTRRFAIEKSLMGADIRGRNCCLKITNISHIMGIFQRQTLKECIFEEQSMPSNPSFSPSDDNEYFQRLQQIVFGHAYQRVLDRIVVKYKLPNGKLDRKNAPTPVDFCYHIRNGCFHGNKFNITTTVYGDTWRNSKIAKDLINGTKVMGLNDGFLGLADVIVLLYDLENAVYRQGKERLNGKGCLFAWGWILCSFRYSSNERLSR